MARFPLVAISVRTGNVLWTSEAFAHGEGEDRFGQIFHYVDLVAGDNLVGVFGRARTAADYVEAFDVKTGHAVLRFNMFVDDER